MKYEQWNANIDRKHTGQRKKAEGSWTEIEAGKSKRSKARQNEYCKVACYNELRRQKDEAWRIEECWETGEREGRRGEGAQRKRLEMKSRWGSSTDDGRIKIEKMIRRKQVKCSSLSLGQANSIDLARLSLSLVTSGSKHQSVKKWNRSE